MKRNIFQPWNLLLIIGLFFGVALSVFTPFATGFDEVAHLARIFDISGLHMMPNSGPDHKTAFFTEFTTLSQRRLFFRDQGFALFKPDHFRVQGNYGGMTIKETASTYPPLIFLPQAFVAGVGWRLFNLPIIPVTILIRLVGLAIYLGISYIALRVIPIGKWGLLVVALTPTALYQASTVSGDGFTSAVSFLFIAQVVYAVLKTEEKISNRQLIALCVSIFLLSVAKQGAIILFPLVLIIQRGRFSTRSQRISLGLVILIATFLHFFWYFLTIESLTIGPKSLVTSLGAIFNQLLEYLQAFARSLLLYHKRLYTTMVAAYGYWIGEAPKSIYWVFPLTLLLSLFTDRKNENLTPGKRLFFFSMMIFSWLVILMLYTIVLFTAGNYQGTEKITFVLKQGRYLIPYLPLLVVSLAGLYGVQRKLMKPLLVTVLAGIIVVQGLFLLGLYAHYYTPCGPSAFSGEICRLPAYQNLDRLNPPLVSVDQTVIVEQGFTNTCLNVQTVEVFVFGVEPGSAGQVRFSLLDNTGKLVASDSFEASQISPKTNLVLHLANGPRLSRGEYFIRIEAPELVGSLGLAIRQPDVYQGALMVNQTEIDGDLVFYFTCAPAGWFRY